jgi:hypothetical protein
MKFPISGSAMMSMHKHKMLCYLALLLLQALPLLAQKENRVSYTGIREEAEMSYGPDPDLLNGKKYNFTYRSAEGNPFFDLHDNAGSSIRIKGKIYEDEQVKFDIYNQLVVLDFTDLSGATSSIVLRNDWVEEFNLGDISFKKFPDKNGSLRFGQVVFEGEITCVYFWKKTYIPEQRDGEMHYRFSGPLREAVVIIGGVTCGFKNKTGFLKCLPKEYRSPVRTEIKSRHLRIRKAGDQEMKALMQYINQILGYGE